MRPAVRVTLVVLGAFVLLGGRAAFGDGPSPPSLRGTAYWIYLRNQPGAKGALTSEQVAPLTPRAQARLARAGWTPQACDLSVPREWIEQLRSAGVRPRTVSRWFNAISAILNREQRDRVGALPFVRGIRPVRYARRSADEIGYGFESIGPAAPAGIPSTRDTRVATLSGEPEDYGPSFGQLADLGIPELHAAGLDGAGVLIGILDSGFHKDHPALAHLDLFAERDFVDGDDETQNWDGVHGAGDYHGTFTLSALAGYAPGALIGPAYRASFVLARTEDVDVEVRAEEDHFVAALEWADSLGVDLVNVSLGYRCFTDDDLFCYPADSLNGVTAVTTRAVNLAARRGIAVIVAAGNVSDVPGPISIMTPADSDSCIAVGAVYPWSEVTSFSAHGPTADGRVKPDLCARGSQVVCARWYPDTIDIGTAGGTSLAAPLVTGLAALLLQQADRPAMELVQTLRAIGDRSHEPDCTYGFGVPWAPFASAPDRSCVSVDSLAWSLPPAANWTSELRACLKNRGNSTSAAGRIEWIGRERPVCSGAAREFPALAPDDTAWVGPWEVDFAGMEFATWAEIVARLSSNEGHVFRSIAFQLDDPLVPASWAGVRAWPMPWTGQPLQILCMREQPGTVDITLHEISGRRVALLARDVWMDGGRARFELKESALRGIGNGRYWLRLHGDGRMESSPLIIIR